MKAKYGKPSDEELSTQIHYELVEELSASEKRYRELVENLSEAVFQCDNTGSFSFLTNRFTEITGYTLEEALGRHPTSFMAEEGSNNWPDFPASGEPSREFNVRFRRADGENVWLSASLSTGPNNQRTGLLADISQAKEIEGKLWRLEKMDAIGRLSSGIAHDFANLLTIVIQSAEAGLEAIPQESEAARDHVETILATTNQASKLTRQLMAFGRQQEMNYQIIRISDVLDEMKILLSRILGAGIQIEFKADDTSLKVRIDPAQLEQVLLNLAINARDAMPDGGTIQMELRRIKLQADEAEAAGLQEGPYALLTVSDTGVGIPPENLSKLFEPFFTTKTESEGTGLGLAMTYGTIRQSGGSVDAESQVGQGTSFRIHLPLVTKT
ncbi:MAG: ATP-binding protein [Myxococcota bacterium]